jgi:peptidoglycan/LPS O-acetylase OafA/YrhL
MPTKSTKLSGLPEPKGEPLEWIVSGRVPSLDGIRGVSVFLVIFHHFLLNKRGLPHIVELFVRRAAIGVDIFFVISGFLITLLLLRELRNTSKVSLRGFYRRRAFRILPAYTAFCLIMICASHLGIGPAPISAKAWLSAATFMVDFTKAPWLIAHFWTLSVEEHFYIVYPCLFWLSRKTALLVGGVCILVTPFLRLLLIRYQLGTPHPDFWTLTRSDSIAIGCCLAFFVASPYVRILMIDRWTAGVVCLVAIATLAVSGLECDTKWTIWAANGLRHSTDALLIAVLVWILVYHSRTLGAFLNSRVLVGFGILSYSMYLWQQPFTHITSLSSIPGRLLMITFAAIGSYYLVELPFLSLKARRKGISLFPCSHKQQLPSNSQLAKTLIDL